jgi:hypothetical protein
MLAGSANFSPNGRIAQLDRKIPSLIYNRSATGVCFGLRRGEDFDLAQLDALVADGARTTVYSGFWAGFHLGSNRALDCLNPISGQKQRGRAALGRGG